MGQIVNEACIYEHQGRPVTQNAETLNSNQHIDGMIGSMLDRFDILCN